MTDIKHIFFDLDHTLWDFEANSADTLREIIEEINTDRKLNLSYDSFMEIYVPFNDHLWDLYREEKITKDFLRIERFAHTLRELGINDEETHNFFADKYVEESPKKTKLFPNAIESLEYLSSKYNLHIITNGFNEVQFTKIKSSKLDKFFKNIYTSENVGVKKPNKFIYDFAINDSKATYDNSVMIGDNLEADIKGAIEVGMRAIFFNPDRNEVNCTSEKVSHIEDLIELKTIL